MSAEKVTVLRALGATIIRTPTEAAWDAPESHIGVANRLLKEIPNSHILNQYDNVDNPLAHEMGTAEEIWKQTGGKITHIVAGAGTGGTISGIARGLKKHNKDIVVVAADPYGSILAQPEELNQKHANEGYKVEGIGYDFIPDVLDRSLIDKWYKTEDVESFDYARRLIREEGILVGGSSGSSMAAMVKAVKEMKLGKDAVVVVVCPDSIRSYLSKFADDDWLAANDLLPPTPQTSAPASPKLDGSSKKDPWAGATLRELRLKPVTTVVADSACANAIEVMREKGFDQLPVLASPGGKLVGLVTLGNLLSYVSRGRATGRTPVRDVMFDFSKIPEVVTDAKDFTNSVPGTNGLSTEDGKKIQKTPKRKFVQITMDTPISALSKFFEWNSAAIVTAEGDATHAGKPVAVVTKVDLLSWMMKQTKV